MKRTYNKLVRDKIPEIIEGKGEIAVTKRLTNEEYWNALLEKALEELNEVRSAEDFEETKTELADLLEIVRAMAEYKGFSLEEIIEEANNKAGARGKFADRIFLIGVD